MRSLLVALVTLLPGMAQAADDWPQFRGPHGDGHAGPVDLPTTWDGGFLFRPAWRASIRGTGWSSPIVIKDRVWVTSAEQTALTAKAFADTLADRPYGDQLQAHASVDLMATEIDAKSGKVLRILNVFTRDDPSPIHLANTYASPTPVTDGERLYCHFGSLGTVAVSLKTGQVVWEQRFPVDDITGPGGSPVICNDRLILTRDGADRQFVVALDCRSGDIL